MPRPLNEMFFIFFQEKAICLLCLTKWKIKDEQSI